MCKVVSPLWRLAGGGGAELSSVIYYFSFRFFVGSFQSIGARCEKTLFVPPFVWLSFTTTATDYKPRAKITSQKRIVVSQSQHLSAICIQYVPIY